MNKLIVALVAAGGVVAVFAAGLTIASRLQRAGDTASRPRIMEAITSITTTTLATPSPISENERIRNELLSLGLAIERVDFLDTMPAWIYNGLQIKPDIAIQLASNASSFESSIAQFTSEYVLRYEAQTGSSIRSYSAWLQDTRASDWTSINPSTQPIDDSTPGSLNDAHATETVRAMLNLTSDEARKYVNVSVATLKLSKTQRQIARIEVQDSLEAQVWLTKFGGDTQSPQRVIIDKLGDIAKLNSQEDIEIIFAGLSVPNAQGRSLFTYFRFFYFPQELHRDDLSTNDPLYIPSAPPSGPPTAMPTVLPHMISPLPTPATP